MKKKVATIYRKLRKAFGPQHWWPGDTPFEVMVGAILTQNAAWSNVEKAIKNLKAETLLAPLKMSKIPLKKLKNLIRPSGFYNVKAARLKNFLKYLNNYNNNIRRLKKRDMYTLRNELLSLNGIGRETADSILLYALDKPIFVIDAYTRRILGRHKLASHDADYDDIQKFFMDNLPLNSKIFNEFHALIVRTGKIFCRSKRPLCGACPLNGI